MNSKETPMGLTEGRGPKSIWKNPAEIIRLLAPENPVMVLCPQILRATARRYLHGFPGMVTYAVKANPDDSVIRILAECGINGFDVASPCEIDLIGRLAPKAARHYHNPVRAQSEIRHAVDAGIRAWSVDSRSELEKLFALVPPDNCEISARFKLPVQGAAYDFGSKFGATPELAAELLRAVAMRGYIPSLTFHPGTQCTDPHAWHSYIAIAAEICRMAGIRARRLNLGGGFPAHRVAAIPPDLSSIFELIDRSATQAFGDARPQLVCEPGRGLCADAFSLITRIKAIRDHEHVFLNDGVYGTLTELPQIGNLDRIEVFDPQGKPRQGTPLPRVVFGPTCDSLDRLPGEVFLPQDTAEGDHVIFHGVGAYSTVTNTRFNGFGQVTHLSVQSDS